LPRKSWVGTTNGNFGTATNWSDGAAPVNGDILDFNHLATRDVDAGLSTALTTVTLNVERSFAYKIGIRSGSTITPLTLAGGTLNMPRSTGSGFDSGSPQVMVAFGSTAAVVNIEDSNADGDVASIPTVQVTGTSLTVKQSGGNLGLAVNPGEATTVVFTITEGNGQTTPKLYIGEGVTITSGVANAGEVYDRSNNTRTSIRVSGATWEIAATSTGATTTMTIDEGRVIDNGSGNITTLTARAEYDASGNPSGKTITNSTFERGYNVNIDNGDPNAFTFTNATQFPDGAGAGTLRTPQGIKMLIDNI